MAKYVTGYAMKGLKRPTFSPDNILVLPKTLGELPDRNPCFPLAGMKLKNSTSEHLPDSLKATFAPV
jgi:hypothetical protein